MGSFDVAFDRLLKHEGGFDDNPKDRGNWTSGIIGEGQLKGSKYGISAMTYPDLDIKNLTEAQARAIYKRDFWERAKADHYDFAIAFQLFDAAVNSGIGNAIRFLQRAADVLDDGSVGPATLAAIKALSVTDLLMRFNAYRLMFLTRTKAWPTYGGGWANRVAGNLLLGAEDS